MFDGECLERGEGEEEAVGDADEGVGAEVESREVAERPREGREVVAEPVEAEVERGQVHEVAQVGARDPADEAAMAGVDEGDASLVLVTAHARPGAVARVGRFGAPAQRLVRAGGLGDRLHGSDVNGVRGPGGRATAPRSASTDLERDDEEELERQ